MINCVGKYPVGYVSLKHLLRNCVCILLLTSRRLATNGTCRFAYIYTKMSNRFANTYRSARFGDSTFDSNFHRILGFEYTFLIITSLFITVRLVYYIQNLNPNFLSNIYLFFFKFRAL